MRPTNYFTCTLGEAAESNAGKPFENETIEELFESQAESIPHRPALGFPMPVQFTPSKNTKAGGKELEEHFWNYEVFSYADLLTGSSLYAKILLQQSRYMSVLKLEKDQNAEHGRRAVAMICPSSPVFVFAWLGLMKMGYSVLLIAPGGTFNGASLTSLCLECKVKALLFDEQYRDLAESAANLSKVSSRKDPQAGITTVVLPYTKLGDVSSFIEALRKTSTTGATSPSSLTLSTSANEVAYLHHTSGTSGGRPKPIPQTHRAGCGVLPRLDGASAATFSTTPLYHGGIADCFRAWTSGALIWLFPGKDVPITGDNVLRSLECARRASDKSGCPPVRYFSSVPFVLQMVAESNEGLEMLKSMDIVGVGGAALPETAGDKLVDKGVNLISRFGSAECGFLMSSYRDFERDRAWQYLRAGRGSSQLRFERREEDGLSELIIQPNWPHMAKRNHKDGSYSTADLFEPHPDICNAWRYHSRSDSQLTLLSGKKFDPANTEDAIATSLLLSDVFVFGNGWSFPGALLFRSKDSHDLKSYDILAQVWPQIDKINRDSASHARLSKSMIVIMPPDAHRPEKSSKGTILRGQAQDRYREHINAAYDQALGAEATEQSANNRIEDRDVQVFIQDTIQTVTSRDKGEEIREDEDLFSIGVDSIACMQIRAILQNRLIPNHPKPLPLNVVYDCGSIEALSKYVLDCRHGKATQVSDEVELMQDLVTLNLEDPAQARFSRAKGLHDRPPSRTLDLAAKHIVVLTGATGTLGSHILDQLRWNTSVTRIYCLVRAVDANAARARVEKALAYRKKSSLHTSDYQRVVCLPARLRPILIKPETHLQNEEWDDRLGLSQEVYDEIGQNATVIIHAAWAVNFRANLRSFEKDDLAGLRSLLKLAYNVQCYKRPRFVFCSSTASVVGSASPDKIKERISHDPNSAAPLGYARSKWVGEAICEKASQDQALKGRISIARIGQLCGDTKHGIWNTSEAWPLMLSAALVLKALPDLDEKLSWLPVDTAATVVNELALVEPSTMDKAMSFTWSKDISVYHVVNPNTTPSWKKMLEWIRASPVGIDLEVIKPWMWVKRLEELGGEHESHPAKKLLGLWKNAYSVDQQGTTKQQAEFVMTSTAKASNTMRDVKPIDSEHFQKIWSWIVSEAVAK